MTKDEQIELLLEVLQECVDYFDDEADVVDGVDGKPEANRAMSMSILISNALALIPTCHEGTKND
jgi:hypothetical protein